MVATPQELEEAYRIRHEIFVEEQRLFPHSDRDEDDTHAIHLIALYRDTIVGTVRVYQRGEGVWYGSRLAVRKPYRGRVGKRLIEKAVETVAHRGAERFLAYVQLPTVAFFKRCGWAPVGGVVEYHGAPHQLMEAGLSKGKRH